MKAQSPPLLVTVFLAAALALAGCSTSSLFVSQWSHPAYAAPSFKRIMIGWGGGEAAIRRNFEDEFVVQLKAAGVDALPSYRQIPEDERVDEARLKQAAKSAGADAAIFVRPVRLEHKTEYYPGFYPYPYFGVFGPHVGATWHGFYGAPGVRHYDVATSEATLYDVGKNEVMWTGTARSAQSDHVDAAIKEYVRRSSRR